MNGIDSDAVTAAAVERLTCRMIELAVDVNTHIGAVVLGRAPENDRASLDQVLDDELPRYAEALGRLGR